MQEHGTSKRTLAAVAHRRAYPAGVTSDAQSPQVARNRSAALRRNGQLAALQAAAGACLIVASAYAPWAHYRTGTPAVSHSLSAGPYGGILVATGAAAIILAVCQLAFRSPLFARSSLVLGAATSVAAIAAALTRIARANDLTVNAGGTTSYAIGALVGVVAALVFTTSAVVAGQRA